MYGRTTAVEDSSGKRLGYWRKSRGNSAMYPRGRSIHDLQNIGTIGYGVCTGNGVECPHRHSRKSRADGVHRRGRRCSLLVPVRARGMPRSSTGGGRGRGSWLGRPTNSCGDVWRKRFGFLRAERSTRPSCRTRWQTTRRPSRGWPRGRAGIPGHLCRPTSRPFGIECRRNNGGRGGKQRVRAQALGNGNRSGNRRKEKAASDPYLASAAGAGAASVSSPLKIPPPSATGEATFLAAAVAFFLGVFLVGFGRFGGAGASSSSSLNTGSALATLIGFWGDGATSSSASFSAYLLSMIGRVLKGEEPGGRRPSGCKRARRHGRPRPTLCA